MRYTKKQAHILANLDRIAGLSLKNSAKGMVFELDGVDCTQQVVLLEAQKKLSLLPNGALTRVLRQEAFA